MRQIWITEAGRPEVLKVKEAPDPRPGAGELRIRVEAAGINFADILGRMGIYPDLPPLPLVVGYEVAGRVDAVGSDADSDWVGKDVAALTAFGGYSDVVCVPRDRARVRPAGMTAEEGAALPVTYLTAYQLIVVMGGLSKGDTILIHAAAGGVGTAATQLAKYIGATVIGTASKHKHNYLTKHGVDHCIDYRKEDFVRRVREITEGRGVDLALDAVGGASYQKSFDALARTGRLGMFGMSSAASGKSRSFKSLAKFVVQMPWIKFNPARLMNDNKGVFGVNLGHMWGETERLATWLDALLDLYKQGHIKPVVDRTFAFEHAAKAHHYIQDRNNVGKVLLVP